MCKHSDQVGVKRKMSRPLALYSALAVILCNKKKTTDRRNLDSDYSNEVAYLWKDRGIVSSKVSKNTELELDSGKIFKVVANKDLGRQRK